jgi:hypothetical protein
MRLASLPAVGTLAIALSAGFAQDPVEKPAERTPTIDRFLSAQEAPLTSYRALRTLSAETRGGKMRASLEATTSLDANGFSYRVIEETGSGTIRSKVLHGALEAEERVHKSAVPQIAISTENYQFLPGTIADAGLVRVGIRPRRRAPMLVEGDIFLSEPGADLVRIEGTLVKKPSIWTRRVHVVRQYARIAGVRVPVSMTSTADVFVAESQNSTRIVTEP